MKLIRHVPSARKPAQRGAAALMVVMLLFFVISMVAAYTSRNLIFEQRTGTNQYRSTQALEAAEAGVDWALGQLNAGRTTTACEASTDDVAATDISFRERYLIIDSATGNITFRTASAGGSVQPRCVFDGSSATKADWKWTCHCPLANQASTTISAPGGAGPAPAFIMQMRRAQGAATRLDVLQIESNSCTRLGTDCVNFNTVRGGTGDGVAAVRSVISLRGALTRLPAGALTVGGSLAALPSGVTLSLINGDIPSNGVTVHAAGTVPSTGLALTGLPGAAPSSTMVTGDASLTPTAVTGFPTADRQFAAFFGMLPSTYMRQPGLPTLDCSASCDAAAINTARLRNPGRPIWLTGSAGTVNIDANIGTAAVPALLIIEGDVTVSNGVTVNALVYGRKPSWNWTVAGTSAFNGAVVSEGGLTLLGSGPGVTVTYDPLLLKTLRVSYGTFVRVPGGWKDF